MALFPELKGDAEAAYLAMREELRQRAAQKLGAQNTVIHDLRAEDLGGSSSTGFGTANLTSANTYVDLITSGGNTIANNRWIGINGFHNGEGEGEVSLIRISRGQTVARKWPANHVKNFKHASAWTNWPVIINDNTNVTIAVLARSANTAASLQFFGAVADRNGAAISV